MEERIARLERANRRWRVLAVALIVAGMVAAGASDDRLYVRDLKARGLAIVDDKMATRILLSAYNDTPSLSFTNAKGEVAVVIQAVGGGPTALGISGSQTNGKEKKGGILMVMDKDGSPVFAMTDGTGKVLARLPAAPDR